MCNPRRYEISLCHERRFWRISLAHIILQQLYNHLCYLQSEHDNYRAYTVASLPITNSKLDLPPCLIHHHISLIQEFSLKKPAWVPSKFPLLRVQKSCSLCTLLEAGYHVYLINQACYSNYIIIVKSSTSIVYNCQRLPKIRQESPAYNKLRGNSRTLGCSLPTLPWILTAQGLFLPRCLHLHTAKFHELNRYPPCRAPIIDGYSVNPWVPNFIKYDIWTKCDKESNEHGKSNHQQSCTCLSILRLDKGYHQCQYNQEIWHRMEHGDDYN